MPSVVNHPIKLTTLVLAVFSLLLLASSCTTIGYILEQAYGQFALLAKRKSIDTILKDPATPPKLKKKLERVMDVSAYLKNDLGLDPGKNYSTYVDIKRPWVIQSLSAAPACDLTPYEWSFPIVGKFPYLGFFKAESAQKWGADMTQKGFDISIRDVQAYSTLGWFSDPVLSSFINDSDTDLISIIIHETVHVRIYKKNEMTFNENIASFIEEKATADYLMKRSGPNSPEVRLYQEKLKKEKEYIDFLKTEFNKIKIFYTTSQNCEAIRETRGARFQEIEKGLKERFGVTPEINNAFLSQIALYNINLETLEAEYKTKFNNNLQAFTNFYHTTK